MLYIFKLIIFFSYLKKFESTWGSPLAFCFVSKDCFWNGFPVQLSLTCSGSHHQMVSVLKLDSAFVKLNQKMWFDRCRKITAGQSLLRCGSLGLGAVGAPQGGGRIEEPHNEVPPCHLHPGSKTCQGARPYTVKGVRQELIWCKLHKTHVVEQGLTSTDLHRLNHTTCSCVIAPQHLH